MLRLGFRRSRSAPVPRADGTDAPAPPSPPAPPARPRWTVRLAAAGLALAGALLLLEVGLRTLSAFDLIHVPRPIGSDDAFWDGRHGRFGVWHRPDASAAQRSHSFNVRYETNSLGARDAEHALAETRPRLMALGDSCFEGWGVEQDQRVTDLLEKSSGFEILNFAMSRFGPYQELLAYREFGPRYEHRAVLVGILPMDDFDDLDLAVARRSPGYMDPYRPYLSGSFPDYHRVDLQESKARRFLRHESAAYNALAYAWFVLSGGKEELNLPPPFASPTGVVHSFYYDYDHRDYLMLRYCLEQITTEAQGRPVIVVLLPSPPDFLRFAQAGPPPLTKELEAQSRMDGFHVIDLLPGMAARSKDWSEYFFDRDFHWNEVGHAVAADILARDLRESFTPLPAFDPHAAGVRTAKAADPHAEH